METPDAIDPALTDSALAKIATALDAYPDPQHPNRRGKPTLPARMAAEILSLRAQIRRGACASQPAEPFPQTFHEALEAAERAYWAALMPRHGGDVDLAVVEAGVNRSTIYKRLSRLGLGRELIRRSKYGRQMRSPVREPRSPIPPDLRRRRQSDRPAQ